VIARLRPPHRSPTDRKHCDAQIALAANRLGSRSRSLVDVKAFDRGSMRKRPRCPDGWRHGAGRPIQIRAGTKLRPASGFI